MKHETNYGTPQYKHLRSVLILDTGYRILRTYEVCETLAPPPPPFKATGPTQHPMLESEGDTLSSSPAAFMYWTAAHTHVNASRPSCPPAFVSVCPCIFPSLLFFCPHIFFILSSVYIGKIFEVFLPRGDVPRGRSGTGGFTASSHFKTGRALDREASEAFD